MSTKTNNHIIWSNYNLDLKDWIEDIKENHKDCEVDDSNWTEDMFYQEMVEVNDLYLDDERCNLNIPTEVKSLSLPNLVFGTAPLTHINSFQIILIIFLLVYVLKKIVITLSGGLILTTIFVLVSLIMMVLISCSIVSLSLIFL